MTGRQTTSLRSAVRISVGAPFACFDSLSDGSRVTLVSMACLLSVPISKLLGVRQLSFQSGPRGMEMQTTRCRTGINAEHSAHANGLQSFDHSTQGSAPTCRGGRRANALGHARCRRDAARGLRSSPSRPRLGWIARAHQYLTRLAARLMLAAPGSSLLADGGAAP
jgi:hypothetical protein